MIKIQQAVIVEGKYDKIKLASVLDTLIIETDGFQIFKDKEKLALIRLIANEKGLVILTDSDSAGFLIRSYIGGSVPADKVIHAYIPDVFGKEKRKTAPSKEGKLGVEGMSRQALLTALEQAGVTCDTAEKKTPKITKLDLYEDGFSGTANSRQRKAQFLRYLNLPQRLSSNALVDLLNAFMEKEEYKAHITACFASTDKPQD